ncbi:hypothetical protein LWC35_05060 [Pseudonocardia kujensis]|uniref:hypothetical protein n=1 Tax=Pseudonocardia kujensis TaxID=1128675 RepID=UPI001E4B5313|nr:hypothetical protein [Pseudonocardia kujensis]MCE0762282.1 hypothetical protein [Pseudonocardia kujensis]
MAWLILLWMPIYGAGALLIREVVLRRGRGWPSILLLAIAYEIVEDGIGLQALSSPRLYDAASWGARILGINAPYWEANALYHAVFTVSVPIALTDLLFPAHRARPYLGRTGTAVAAVMAVLGVAVLRLTVPPSQDPGYQAPLPVVLGCLVLVLALVALALRVLPPTHTAPAKPAAPPRLVVLYGASATATLVFFGLSFPVFGQQQPAFTHGLAVLVPMGVTAVTAIACYRFLSRAAARPAWTQRHTLAVVGGALVAHSVGGLVIMARTAVDRVGLVAIIGLTVLGLVVLDRRLRTADITGGGGPAPLGIHALRSRPE